MQAQAQAGGSWRRLLWPLSAYGWAVLGYVKDSSNKLKLFRTRAIRYLSPDRAMLHSDAQVLGPGAR